MSFQMFVHTVDTKGKLQSSVSPSSANDLANKSYVDSAIASGGGDWEASVLDQLATPPGTPSSGDRYLVVATASGAWSGKEGDIAEYNGSSWDFTTPSKGTHVYDEDSGNALIYNGTAWVVLANATGALIASNNLSDVSSQGSARANLGLGALATASSVNLGTDVSGTLAVTSGGTGATSASSARSNLGLGTSAVVDLASASSDSGKIAALGSISGSPTAVTVNSSGAIIAATLGGAASEDVASSRSDSGKLPKLGSISGSPTAVTVDGGGEIVAATLGGAASEDVASSRSDAGKLPKLGTISGSPTAVTVDGGGEIVAATLGTAASATIATGLSSTAGNLLKVKSGSNLSSGNLLAVDANGDIVAGSGGGGGTVTSITPDADSGTGSAITTSGSIKIAGDGGAISTSVSGTDVTISASDASTSAKGVAKFSSSHFSVSSGEVSLSTVAITSGGTGATSALQARSQLGLAIGSDVQAYNINLSAISNISPSNGEFLLYSSGAWDKSTYGEFSAPIRPYTSVPTVGSGGTTIAPSSVSSAYELYILDLSSATSASTLTLPTPASGDVGKSIEVKLMGSMGSTNKLTVSVSGGSDKFDGLTSIDMDQDYQRLKFTVMAAGGSGNDCYALG